MNERILKLFEQSLGVNYIPAPIEDHVPSWTEKFAELIVLEVLNVQENLMANGHNAWHLHKPTKKHFGIRL